MVDVFNLINSGVVTSVRTSRPRQLQRSDRDSRSAHLPLRLPLRLLSLVRRSGGAVSSGSCTEKGGLGNPPAPSLCPRQSRRSHLWYKSARVSHATRAAPPPRRRARLRVGRLAFTWPLPMQLGTHLTGDPGGDTGVYVWNQWVFQHEALVEGHNPFSHRADPLAVAIASISRSTTTPSSSTCSRCRSSRCSASSRRSTSSILLMIVLTALVTFVLARRVTAATRVEAWLAGLAFAWSPVLVARSHRPLQPGRPRRRCRRSSGACSAPSGPHRRAMRRWPGCAWRGRRSAMPTYAIYCLMIAGLYVASHRACA